jgi:broad specificity phosphatase PhoE
VTAARVICWRHGRTAHNHGGIWQGQLDVPLDDVGREQAEDAAAALSASLTPGEPLMIVSSDLARASATAAALGTLTGVEVRLDRRLREIDAGRWEGLTRAEIVEAGMGDDLSAWRRGDDVRIGGGERRSEVARRGAAALRQHAEALHGGTLVVVAHGGLLRGSILDVLDLPGQRWDLLGGLGNGHWAELHPGRPSWRLHAYNVRATPIANRFGGAPQAGGRLAEPRR